MELSLLCLPGMVYGSALLAPSSGSADNATAGSTIAEPLCPLGAQFSNPAGLAGFTDAQAGMGLGLAYGRGVVTATDPAGYSADNEVVVPFVDSFLVIPYDRWTFGIGSMGTSGARFQYGARPAVGVDDGFYSESGIVAAPLSAAYRVSDSLWLGGELIPLYGSTHLRYSQEVAEFPGAPTPFRFTVSGFGVQGMLGATWKPDENWSLGASLKPPGRIWADGDAALGSGKQNVNLELEAPLEASVGVTRAFADRWKASYALRFSDTSVLGKSYIRFQKTPSGNVSFLPDSRDEWRHALGIQYRWSDSISTMAGFSKANGIVGNKGISPLSYDSRDWRLSTGIRWKGEGWGIDGSFGYIFSGSRNVSANDALIFPGKYDSKPAYMLSVTLTKHF